jgi:hypothetical protein
VLHTLLIATALAFQPATESSPQVDPARAFMDSLAYADTKIDSMTGQVQYTVIQALESDLQKRIGNLYLRTLRDDQYNAEHRDYAVRFNLLEIDDRQEDIREHYIFDGRWFVERLPDQKQFNKRELVAAGEQLDPMELMREAPFWVSLGRNTDRVFESYDVELHDHEAGLMDNPDFPELTFLAPTVKGAKQIQLTPKPGTDVEDDWEWVRIWFDHSSLLPMLYVKADWTGDLQIVQLFSVQTNIDLENNIFDTTTPPPEAGWRTQTSPWRGEADSDLKEHVDTQPLEDRLNESSP